MLQTSVLCSYSTKVKNIFKKYGFGVICVSAQRTSNQDLLLRDPTVSKVTHYPQITKFPWPTSRMCSAVPRALQCCHAVLYFRMNTHQERKTRQTARIRCYLKLCVQSTWNQEGLLNNRTVIKFILYTQETKISWHKCFNCTECAHMQRGSSCTIVSPFFHHIYLVERNLKTPKVSHS